MKIYLDNDIYQELELVSEESGTSMLNLLFNVIKSNVHIRPKDADSNLNPTLKVIIDNIDNYKK